MNFPFFHHVKQVFKHFVIIFQGDSGGPLICRSNKVAGILIQGGDPCDNPAHPQKFINVGFYKKWINRTLRQNPVSFGPRKGHRQSKRQRKS